VVSLLNKTIDLLDQFEQALARFGDSDLQTRCAEARGMLYTVWSRWCAPAIGYACL
jgi:hypothetical protein